jgi:predicted phage-related endonuclease
MLKPEQFIASKALFPSDWVRARKEGVTATQVSRAATPAGFEQAVNQFWEEFQEPDNPYMAFGRDMEPVLAKFVHERFGILPNEWLIANADTVWHLATPDGLSLDHEFCSEIKTTGQDWEDKAIPIQYRRQVQWQLHVTGASACLFAWMLRIDVDGVFAPAWFEPKSLWIERDEDMISSLVDTADKLWERIHYG